MTKARTAKKTVQCVDTYSKLYKDLSTGQKLEKQAGKGFDRS